MPRQKLRLETNFEKFISINQKKRSDEERYLEVVLLASDKLWRHPENEKGRRLTHWTKQTQEDKKNRNESWPTTECKSQIINNDSNQ